MDKLISELVSYGMVNGLIAEDDKVYVINRLLELFEKKEKQEFQITLKELKNVAKKTSLVILIE
mgnify:CR=1 FL=1